MNKVTVKYVKNYDEDFVENFETFDDALDFIDDLENEKGGFATQILQDDQLVFVRVGIEDEVYWFNPNLQFDVTGEEDESGIEI